MQRKHPSEGFVTGFGVLPRSKPQKFCGFYCPDFWYFAMLIFYLIYIISLIQPLANDPDLNLSVMEASEEIFRKLKFGTRDNNSLAQTEMINRYATLLRELIPLIQPGDLQPSVRLAISIVNTILLVEGTADDPTRLLYLVNPIDPSIKRSILILILSSLSKLEIFGTQSNVLCTYSLCLLNQFNNITADDGADFVSRATIGDFLIDVCCMTQPLEKGAIGSVQPGLSAERVDRLTCLQPKWSILKLKEVKELIMQHVLGDEIKATEGQAIFSQLIPTKYRVAMAIILSQDRDSSIATQAVFKMNGAANLFKIHNNLSESDNPSDTLQYLISLCSSKTNEKRIPLRNVVQIALIRWICKEMTTYFSHSAKAILTVIVQAVFGTNSSLMSPSNAGLLTAFALLMETLIKNLDTANLQNSCILLVQSCKKVLIQFATSQVSSAATNSDYNSEMNLATRSSCYAVIETAANRVSDLVAKDVELIVLLFRLLGQEDERIITKLYVALENLQQAHIRAGN